MPTCCGFATLTAPVPPRNSKDFRGANRFFGMASRLILALLGFFAALLLSEFGIRLLHLAPVVDPIVIDKPWATFVSSPNPLIKYVPKPGARDINAYGIRDHDYNIEKEKGTYR